MPHSKDKIESARRLRAEGRLLREIANELGIPLGTAAYWVRGVLPLNTQPQHPRKAEVLPVLERMYREGHPIPVIAKATGVAPTTLFDWRRELGLPKNKRTEYVTDELRARIAQKMSRDPDGSRTREAV